MPIFLPLRLKSLLKTSCDLIVCFQFLRFSAKIGKSTKESNYSSADETILLMFFYCYDIYELEPAMSALLSPRTLE